MTRRIIVIDTETTGLHHSMHLTVELAAVDLDSGREIRIVPPIEPCDMAAAAPEALTINRFYERRLYAEQMSRAETEDRLRELAGWLDGAVFAGCAPAFDAAFVTALFERYEVAVPVWHHRLADLSALTAGAQDLGLDELPGLSRCCTQWGVENEAPHTALGDARATAECLRRLRDHAAARAAGLHPGPIPEPALAADSRAVKWTSRADQQLRMVGLDQTTRVRLIDLCGRVARVKDCDPASPCNVFTEAYETGRVTRAHLDAFREMGLPLVVWIANSLRMQVTDVLPAVDRGEVGPEALHTAVCKALDLAEAAPAASVAAAGERRP